MLSEGFYQRKSQSENCTMEHSNISILYCTYREKTVIRANRVSYKERSFFLPTLYLAGIFPPTVAGGGRPLKQNLKH